MEVYRERLSCCGNLVLIRLMWMEWNFRSWASLLKGLGFTIRSQEYLGAIPFRTKWNRQWRLFQNFRFETSSMYTVIGIIGIGFYLNLWYIYTKNLLDNGFL
jgi:hypothetical protein